ncbi:MAG: 16S rRNA (guanine(966)-N(2))-methyltransferase RsmD [Oscillatoria sp. PMC 1068.18]|nr:16S rRNA (guanine(966)-N(2))-methyltransferase RsmD [Oscillatoria sp. PMC 1076.18]MEC4989953.1 16S rRNA (guanine(966)-N(2))-methyltransferase RsmD [Oscillatoria sp. PMC 1068.18]
MSIRIYGNRQLKTLPGQSTRPTAAKVREALFNIWQGAIADCRWLDLCSGNGSMGAEALCRGAKLVVGIEKNPRACAIIKQNWQQVAREGQEYQLLRGDVVARLKALAGKKFDRIYFDPPYTSNLYDPVLEAIATSQLLDTAGRIAVEHDPRTWTAKEIPQLSLCNEKHYGNTALSFYSLT